jgi:hypothetical protein
MIAARAPIPALLLAAAPFRADAADRTIGLNSFDRVRIEAPVEVRVVTGASPGATVTGDDESVDVRQTGTTIIVARRGGSWQERPRMPRADATVVTLSTPSLAGATLIGGGRLAIDRMKAARIELSVSGGGAMTVGSIDTERLGAGLAGNGTITMSGGRAGIVRLLSNGSGTIDAATLVANELTVAQDGPGEVRAQARYTAAITNTGAGRVTVSGQPRCVLRAVAGPVACGDGRTP